jgi:hypothetical protein
MSEEKAKSIAVAEADANEEEEALKPQTFRLSYEEMARTKRKPDDRAIIIAQPEEMGIDIDELGLPSGSTFAVVIRPFRAGENADIRETVKDFPTETWLQELHDEICMRCVVEPAFPQTAEGLKQLMRWQPGFRSTCASAVQNQSGLGAHTVKNAKEELSKLQGLTRSIS